MKSLLFLFSISFLLNCCSGEVYSATTKIEELLITQSKLVDTLQEYITTTESKLKTLKVYLENLKKEQEKASKDVEEYLGNPINDFLLIKRLTHDWKDVEDLIMDNTSSGLINKIATNKSIVLPNAEDLRGAAQAFVRLQMIYDLDISSFASGKIKDKRTDVTLSAKDCYILGDQLYQVGNYQFSTAWLQESLRRYNEEVKKTVKKTDILKYLATVSYLKKDYKRIPKILDEMNKILLDEEKIRMNFTSFQQNLLQVNNNSRKGDDGRYALFYADPLVEYIANVSHSHSKLCRNEIGIREDIRAKLKCRYADSRNAFLKLAKLKEEDVFLNPKILLYHDVIFDEEIEAIKKLAKVSLKRALIINDVTLTGEPFPYRIGQLTYVHDSLHPKLAKLNQRVEDMTGLTTKTAEPYQVVNYGIGGQFDPHFDFKELPDKTRFDPDRYYSEKIATVLFYMNDVELGGATVFPCLNVSVWPKKGLGLVWYDLKLNGAYERRSLHAACPVLKGYKWICNKWMGERGQEFLRPCGLTKDVQ